LASSANQLAELDAGLDIIYSNSLSR
jgi:hypothetical protein